MKSLALLISSLMACSAYAGGSVGTMSKVSLESASRSGGTMLTGNGSGTMNVVTAEGLRVLAVSTEVVFLEWARQMTDGELKVQRISVPVEIVSASDELAAAVDLSIAENGAWVQLR